MNPIEKPALPEKTVIDRHLPTGYVTRGHSDEAMHAYADTCMAPLLARIEELEAAVEFYADVSDYKAPFTGGCGKLWMDCGSIARAALSATKEPS